MKRLLSVACLVVAASSARGANVYILSSSDPQTDSAAAAALTSRGHTVTIGVEYTLFDGSVNLAGFDAVYLQCNANWQSGLMPAAGQQQLISWVNAGGNLVTSEWVVYYTYAGGGKFEALGGIIPAAHSFLYDNLTLATFTQVTPDPAINAGLPAVFDFPLHDPNLLYAGTETFTLAKPGATTYYTTSNSATGNAGLVGWVVGSGTVFSFLSTCGPDQVGDAEFGLLFSNVMEGGAGPCYPDCNQSGSLTIADFACFQAAFAGAQSYADCNNSGTLTIADFACFQAAFAGGCP